MLVSMTRKIVLLVFLCSINLIKIQNVSSLTSNNYVLPASKINSLSRDGITTIPSSSSSSSSSSFGLPCNIHRRRSCNANQQQRKLRSHSGMSTCLQASSSPLVSIIASPIGSLAVLMSIVLIHECGHYLAARLFGIKVEEFSVGVGPKITGFTAFGNEFNLRSLPLGGYVRFPENYNTTLGRQLAIADEEQFQQYIREQNLNVGTQILNALTLGAVVDKMWNDEKEQRRTIQQQQQVQSQKTSLPWWKQITSVTKNVQKPTVPAPLGEIEYYDDPMLLQNRPWQERVIVLSGGVVFNLLTAFVIYFAQIGYGSGLPQPIFDQGIVVTATPKPDAAASGLIRQGDVLIGINGQPITLSKSPSGLESSQAVNEFIAQVRRTPDGQTLKLDVIRNDKPIEVVVQPKRTGTIPAAPQTIGVLLSPNYITSQLVKTDSPIEAAQLAYKYVSALTAETAAGLGLFVKSLVIGTGASGGGGSSQVTGPIGLIRTGSEVVATQDLTSILLFAAAISVNLGVVNALPIPALDGGQLLFVLAEAVTGRKIDQRVEEGVTSIAVLFLILFSISTLFGDISSIVNK